MRPNQIRVPLGHTAEHEKRSANFVLLEEREKAVGVRDDPALHRVPGRPRHDAIEHTDVKVLLHVNAHRVHDGPHAPFLRMTVLTVSKMMKKSSAIERFLM